MSVDQILSTPVEVHPSDFVAGGKGTLEDVFHPQARFTSIKRLLRTIVTGPYAGERVHALLVEGGRPRALNLGVRRFVVAITVDRKRHVKSEEDEARIAALETYLVRWGGGS